MFIVNNKEYKDGKLTFGSLCELEDMGINFNNIGNMTFKAIVGFMSVAMKTDFDTTKEEINSHIEKGGNLEDLIDVVNKMVAESDFFKNLHKGNRVEKQKKNTKQQNNG